MPTRFAINKLWATKWRKRCALAVAFFALAFASYGTASFLAHQHTLRTVAAALRQNETFHRLEHAFPNWHRAQVAAVTERLAEGHDRQQLARFLAHQVRTFMMANTRFLAKSDIAFLRATAMARRDLIKQVEDERPDLCSLDLLQADYEDAELARYFERRGAHTQLVSYSTTLIKAIESGRKQRILRRMPSSEDALVFKHVLRSSRWTLQDFARLRLLQLSRVPAGALHCREARRLIDALVAWPDEARAGRLLAHLLAPADKSQLAI